MALLSEKLGAVRQARPESLLVMSGAERGFMHELLSRFCTAFGTPNFIDGKSTRSASLTGAMRTVLDSPEIPAFDWARADHVLSLEAGFLEDSCQSVYLARAAGEMRRGRGRHRATLVHLGPLFDLSAYNADEWIPMAPGGSCSLALGLCHVLLRDKLYDKDFVEHVGADFDAFATMVRTGFSPDKVAASTGISAAVIARLAEDLAARRPSFAFVDERSLSYSNGFQTALAAFALNALLGAVGPLIRPQRKPPFAFWPAFESDDVARSGLKVPRLDGAGTAAFPLATSVHEALVEALLSGGQKPEALLLYRANPLFARIQPKRWRSALERIPFIVSFSPYLDETVSSIATLVLPDHTFLERWEDAGEAPGVGFPVAGVRRPVVDPMLDTRASGDVLLELAKGLGGSVASAFPWRTFRAALDVRLRGLFEAKRGSIVAPTEDGFMAQLFKEGVWSDDKADPVPIKMFSFSTQYAEPEWDGPMESFPLKLLVYRPLGYAEGGGANLPWLRQLRPRPKSDSSVTQATLHPDSVAGVAHGDTLEIQSPYGSIVVQACIDRRMVLGSIAVPMGGGHEAFGRWAMGRGVNVMHLLRQGAAGPTGATAVCTTRVRVTRKGTAS
jgi:anaerobic selenocysteine-containing dehydrogenase